MLRTAAITCFVCLLLGAGLLFQGKHAPSASSAPASTNHLLLGSKATSSIVSVRLSNPSELDGKAKSELLALRAEQISPFTGQLVAAAYRPSPSVFGKIADNKPWWGLDGIYYYGPGPKSTDGPSEESRFLLNPLLLVGVSEDKPLKTRLEPSGTLTHPEPMQLFYKPAESFAEVVYDVSGFTKHLARVHPLSNKDVSLALTAYNAKDFGYGALRVNKASGIRIDPKQLALTQVVTVSPSCKAPGGCNDATGSSINFVLESLPARLELTLLSQDQRVAPLHWAIDFP